MSYCYILVLVLSSVVPILCRGYRYGDRQHFWTSTKRAKQFSSTFNNNIIPRGGESSSSSSNNIDIDVSKSDSENEKDFEILDEKTVYSGWRTIVQRKVRMRNNKVVDFDLVGVKTGDSAVLIFAWDTKSKTATLIKEYMPASNRILWGLAAGLVEEKHNNHNTELAARHELEEECHLKNGKWIPLLHQPTAMDKYSTTTIQCYLVLDPEKEEDPKPLDEVSNVQPRNLMQVIFLSIYYVWCSWENLRGYRFLV
jgi:ADP-ribose pyrophosphatase YjhB (NUDIX family)